LAPLSPLFAALTVRVVVLPTVAGAVNFTENRPEVVAGGLTPIEYDVPELGIGLGETLTTVQALFELWAVSVK
jgi:hypothetical protein